MRTRSVLGLAVVASAVTLATVVPTFANEPDSTRTDMVEVTRPADDGVTDRTAQQVRAPQDDIGCWGDPAGDTQPSRFDRSDVITFCGGMRNGIVALSTEVVAPTNPQTDPGWPDNTTGALWDIDVNGDGNEDYHVFLLNTGGFVEVTVTDTYNSTRCYGEWDYDGQFYVAMFDTSCIGNPHELSVRGHFTYDTGSTVYADASPSWGGPVGPDSPAGPSTPLPAPDTNHVTTGRVAGGDRYETGVKISQHQFPNGAGKVFLARSDNFPDALAGGVLTGGPILLIPQCGTVPTVVLDEVARLGPSEVLALGGPVAVCDQVIDDVADAAR